MIKESTFKISKRTALDLVGCTLVSLLFLIIFVNNQEVLGTFIELTAISEGFKIFFFIASISFFILVGIILSELIPAILKHIFKVSWLNEYEEIKIRIPKDKYEEYRLIADKEIIRKPKKEYWDLLRDLIESDLNKSWKKK